MDVLGTPSTAAETAELRRTAEAALDELTAALTLVFKAVNKVHRVVDRLNAVIGKSDGEIQPQYQDAPTDYGVHCEN